MKKFLTLFAVASVLMAASCTKENSAPEAQDSRTIQLTLQATRGEADTKTAISGNDTYHSLESVWTTGDVIYVYSIKSGDELGHLTQTGDITNQKTSDAAQYPTSYAAFSGSITLGAGDAITDNFAFVYQGAREKLTVAEGMLTFPMGASNDVAGLNAWDIAYAKGKIIGTEASASAAVSFSNRIAFGYFSTTPVASGSNIDMNYYSNFTLDVKTGTITGLTGKVTVPGAAEFYMPLLPGNVNMSSDKVWSMQGGFEGYAAVQQTKSFTASAGNFYRLGKSSSYGPVEFENGAWTKYNTLKNSIFAVSETQKVHFTEGNLQWINDNPGDVTSGYWQIAPTQYSYLGNGNAKGTANDSGEKLGAGNVDLFGWGEVTAPFLCSTVNSDYSSTISAGNDLITDWATKFNGATPVTLYADYNNTKSYPLTAGESYCVLTKDQWVYLFQNQYWGFATVTMNDASTVNGIVVCPFGVDESTAQTYLTGTVRKFASNVSQITGLSGTYSENSISQAIIDENGLLFLPAAGYRSGYGAPINLGSYGRYWSTTASAADKAYYLDFNSTGLNSALSASRYVGRSVRLASFVQ